MNIVGIISEYNPLHNGHKHQIDAIKALFNNDVYIISLLSSNFVQRGEPAIVDKYARADMAIKCGVDMVLEYPTLFCCASAEAYAQNAIYIFKNTNITRYLCYGSKSTESQYVKIISEYLAFEPEEYKTALKQELDKGISFPKARENALACCLSKQGLEEQAIRNTLKSSNDILAIEYEKAIIRQNAKIETIPIKRIGSDYNDTELIEGFSSATAIRSHLLSTNECFDTISDHVPNSTLEILKVYSLNKRLADMELFKDIITYSILQKDKTNLKRFPLVNEGLENLLKKHINNHNTIASFIDTCMAKRYPSTRIQRLLIHIILGANIDICYKYKKPEYIRILACNDKTLLTYISNNSSLPIVTSLKKAYKSFDLHKKGLVDLENKACDIYNLICLKDSSTYINEFSVKTKI